MVIGMVITMALIRPKIFYSLRKRPGFYTIPDKGIK
jgi:hypothetical protein